MGETSTVDISGLDLHSANPEQPSENMTFSNVTVTDLAAVTVAGPLGNNDATANANITMTDVNIVVQSWTKGNIVPTWTGLTAGSAVAFTLKAQNQTQTLEP